MDTTRCTITSDYHSLTREAVVKLLEQRDAELEQRDAELKNKDAELKNKDAELERKSRRILELERMVFGRRSEKRLPENASDWTGTLFDEQWAKEGSLAQVEALPIIKEIKQQAGQRRASRRVSRPSRKSTTYASYVPENIERQVTEIYPKDYDAERMVIIGHDRSEHLCLRPSSFYVRVEDCVICRLKEARPTDAKVDIMEAPLKKTSGGLFCRRFPARRDYHRQVRLSPARI